MGKSGHDCVQIGSPSVALCLSVKISVPNTVQIASVFSQSPAGLIKETQYQIFIDPNDAT